MYPFLFAIDKEISYSDLKTLLKKGSGIVVDVRSKDEVDKGRISGSIHIPGQRETELSVLWITLTQTFYLNNLGFFYLTQWKMWKVTCPWIQLSSSQSLVWLSLLWTPQN